MTLNETLLYSCTGDVVRFLKIIINSVRTCIDRDATWKFRIKSTSFLHGEKPLGALLAILAREPESSHGGSHTHGACSPTGTDRERFAVNSRLIGFAGAVRENPTIHATTTTRRVGSCIAMQTAVKEALASAIARGVNPRGVHREDRGRVRSRPAPRLQRDGCEGGAAASAESRSEETRVARPPPLRTYYADWAEVILPEGHRFPMEKYQATRLVLEQDKSLSDIMELVPSPVRRHVPFQRGTAVYFERPPRRPPLSRSRTSRHDLTAPSITKPPQKASLIDVLAVHEEGYVTRVLGCALTEKEGRAIGFPMMNPSQVMRSLASTGGTVAATHDVLPPGHHRQVRRADRGRHPPRVPG